MTAFTEKYKPTSISEFVFPDEYAETAIQHWIAASGTSPLLLFGDLGTGKTTLANLLFSELYPSLRNGSRITKIDPRYSHGDKRLIERLRSLASLEWSPAFGSKIYIVIDEIHSMPVGEQEQMRLYLDDYSHRAHHVFTTNYLDRLDAGIRSRCDKVEIGCPIVENWVPRANMILEKQRVDLLSDSELRELIELANGDCREILRSLQRYVDSVKG